MADQIVPAKSIQAVFKRLKSQAENKLCFDCRASNPTWASVTYGVFLCIDCSATHRSLGVHLTFIRSTQLDTNWTWQQIRQMQVGGNAKANAFFRQHNLVTTDAGAKYKSRVASMYREKVQSLASKAMQQYGTDVLLIDTHSHAVPSTPDQKEVDFFHDLEKNFESSQPVVSQPIQAPDSSPKPEREAEEVVSSDLSVSPPKQKDARVPTIGGRKPIAGKKKGLGAKKGGLGATKVNTNFSEIESEAQKIDKMKETTEANVKRNEEDLAASLQYKSKKEFEKLKNADPSKREQMERLGMGMGGLRSEFTHSVVDSMSTVEQVKPAGTRGESVYKDRFSSSGGGGGGFFDSYGIESNGSYVEQPPKYDNNFFSGKSSWEKDMEKEYVIVSKTSEKEESSRSRGRRDHVTDGPSEGAQSKFGNAKSISSDQFFGNTREEDIARHNLDKFSGSSSISSADIFGEEKKSTRTSSLPSVDYAQLKAGVSHVTGKISNMASGVLGSLQSRYSGSS